jgi:hypothetical protein
MRIRRIVALSLSFIIISSYLAFSVDKDKVQYVGGTVKGLHEGTTGYISLLDEIRFVFSGPGIQLAISYDKINNVEYGQKAGRRVGVAIMVSPIALLSKKRKHFLTVSYLDENDKQQVAVFELGKETVRVTLSSLEARTGRKIEYQDEEARKSSAGN